MQKPCGKKLVTFEDYCGWRREEENGTRCSREHHRSQMVRDWASVFGILIFISRANGRHLQVFFFGGRG